MTSKELYMAKSKPTNHDEYFAQSGEFAQPILAKLRKVIHKACPDVVESIKWSAPFYEYQGILMGLGAFKAHVTLSFWRGKEMSDPAGIFDGKARESLEIVRLESLKDLPTERVLAGYVKEAMAINERGQTPAGKQAKQTAAKKQAKKAAKKVPSAPDDLLTALKVNKTAAKTFEDFSPTNKKEYVEWITGAKREATREKRVAQAVEWMAEGKPRNWKYMKQWGGC